MRELQSTTYDSRQYSDENLLYKNKLIDPVQLKKNLTYLWGKDSDMFPLHFLTEGQGAFKSLKPNKTLNDTQYTWDVMGRMKNTSKVIGLANTSNTKPGLGGLPFDVIFEDNWFHFQYGAFSPDGNYQVYINSEPVQVGNGWKVSMVLKTTSTSAYIPLDNFLQGKAWVQAATAVAQSKSDGTRSNTMAPGKWTNQYGLYRYSMEIAGNISNKVTNIEFDLEGGGKTNKWMPFQMKQWEMHIRLMNEMALWYDEYNRNSAGEILLKDPATGEPIPQGAGIKQILKSVNNYDTYSTLTKAKLDSTVKAVFNNRVDDTPMEIVLYTGLGGAEMFHNAIMTDATANAYYQALGDNIVISGGDYLTYGKYFRQYKTIDGKVITVKVVKLFDHGPRAEMQRANGDMYNGYPIDSYTLVFLDQSKTDDGDRNIMMVAEDGREYLTGVYKGMSPVPDVWKALPMNNSPMLLSTRKDVAAYEVMGSGGIVITNPTTSFWLELAL